MARGRRDDGGDVMAKILIADDLEENRYLLQAVLAGSGHEVVCARKGGEALALAGAVPPDVVVTDLLMPAMDGFELCRRWHLDERLRPIPFLVYTATYTDPPHEELARALGADAFITKPQSPEVLTRAVQTLMEQARRGELPARPRPMSEEATALLVRHNEVLIQKLDERNRQLEADIAARERAERERRDLEEKLRHAQRLEALGRLAAGVAHDFNNLLLVILGHASLALDGLRAGDPLREDLEAVTKAAESASVLTRQLLAFARKQALQPRVIDPNKVVLGLKGMLGRLAGSSVRLELELASAPGNVSMDVGQLEQVLVNLAVNAADAMPQGGKLTIRTTAAPGEGGALVVLSVADTGHGMDRATQEHVFEPFFTTKEVGKGTGLGLATVHGIVAQSGGRVEVASTPGEGTTFRVCLPRVDAAEEPVRPAKPVTKGSETVLVVDDDKAVRGVAERLVAGGGYRVVAADSGAGALTVLERCGGAIDLLLVDVMMPGMSGIELGRRVAAAWPKVRIVYMSGYPALDTEKTGGAPVIGKPFTAEALMRLVRDVLDAGR